MTMSKGFIATEILIPNVVYFYGPRPGQQKHSTTPKQQKLRGRLRLVTSCPVHLKRVEIRFKASSQLKWRDPRKSQHSILGETMRGSKTFRKSKSLLLEDATIPNGITEMGFELTLPGTLCDSYQSEYVQIVHTVYAVILLAKKSAKEMVVEREIRIEKTLLPKDVVYGYVEGFQVPRLVMHGMRPGCIAWQFRVPPWVCLEKTVKFDGIFRLGSTTTNPMEIDKIQVDAVQEEVYGDHVLTTKRHLVTCSNAPSVYLHPPPNTPISFSYPLQVTNQAKLCPSSSTPTFLSGMNWFQPRSPVKKIVSPDGDVTLLSHGPFTYSFVSPFLEICHYVRLTVHIRNMAPICIGVPIQITRHLRLEHVQTGGELPPYQTILEPHERLPRYYPPEEAFRHDTSLPCYSRWCDKDVCPHSHESRNPCSSWSIMTCVTDPDDSIGMLSEERTLEDFLVQKSDHQ